MFNLLIAAPRRTQPNRPELGECAGNARTAATAGSDCGVENKRLTHGTEN
jgi:hypothetical protein